MKKKSAVSLCFTSEALNKISAMYAVAALLFTVARSQPHGYDPCERHDTCGLCVEGGDMTQRHLCIWCPTTNKCLSFENPTRFPSTSGSPGGVCPNTTCVQSGNTKYTGGENCSHVASVATCEGYLPQNATCAEALPSKACAISQTCPHGCNASASACVACVKANWGRVETWCPDPAIGLDVACGITHEPTTVELPTYGKLEGFTRSGSDSPGLRIFRGVPFAAPPVGPNRFRSPQPFAPWKTHGTTRKAVDFGTACLQLGPAWPSMTRRAIETSAEDCLFLNVYAPPATREMAGPNGAGFPVMIYMPAGQFVWGSGTDLENFTPPPIAAFADVIVVTVQYRLGALGWLALDELRVAEDGNSTGNWGLQDQRAALAWIQSEISAFGGDKDNVVLWGESAGASIVSTHMVAEKSWPYFHKAVLESGAFNSWTYKPMETARADAYAFANHAGCRDAHNTTLVGAPLVKCLRKLNASAALANLWDDGWGAAGKEKSDLLPYSDTMDKCAWAPTVDGVELLDSPRKRLSGGHVAPNVPVLLGTNRDEGSQFLLEQQGVGDFVNSTDAPPYVYFHLEEPHDGKGPSMEDQVADWSAAAFGVNASQTLMQIYNRTFYPVVPPSHHIDGGAGVSRLQRGGFGAPNEWWEASTIVGDFVLACPTRNAARVLSSAGHSTFLYYFNHTPIFSVNMGGGAGNEGCFHGADVPFFWHDGFELVRADEKPLSEAMATYLTNFVHTGDPNRGLTSLVLPNWPEYKKATDQNIVLGAGDGFNGTWLGPNVTVSSHLKSAECDFWDAYWVQSHV